MKERGCGVRQLEPRKILLHTYEGVCPAQLTPPLWPQTWGQLNCYISATTLDYILCMQQSLRLVCMCVCVQGWGEAVRLLFVWNVIKDVVMTGWNVNKRRCTGRSLPRCSKDMVYPLHIQQKIYFSLIFLCAIVRKWFFWLKILWKFEIMDSKKLQFVVV